MMDAAFLPNYIKGVYKDSYFVIKKSNFPHKIYKVT